MNDNPLPWVLLIMTGPQITHKTLDQHPWRPYAIRFRTKKAADEAAQWIKATHRADVQVIIDADRIG